MKVLSRHTKTIAIAIPFVAAIILSGCSKGSATATTATYSPLTGVFSDAPVAGLTYRTSSGAAGTTDAQGRFNYASDSVTFSVGGMVLGTAVPQLTAAGNAAVTPVGLNLGSTTTDAWVVTVGQLLGTLNSIAVAEKIGANQPPASGMFTMPADTSALMAPILAPFFPTNSTTATTVYVTSISDWLTQLQNLAASGVASVPAAASGVISVPTAANATLNMNQAVNASSVTGTVWTGTSSSSGPDGTFYFQPDGNMTGFTTDGNILAGTWSGSTATPPVSPAVQFSLISSAGVNYSGTIDYSATTATIYNGSNPAYALTQVNSSGNALPLTNPLTNTLYLGGWYGVYTPTNPTSSPDVYGTGTPVYLILSPDGIFSGIMDGNQSNTGTISGSWIPTGGIGSGAFQTSSASACGFGTFSFNMAAKSGTYSKCGVIVGSISFSRTGVLSMIGSPLTSAAIPLIPPLLLNVSITWSANNGSSVSGFPLALNILSGTALIASGIRSEINPLGNGAAKYTMTDSISVPYPAGSATNYALSAGAANCTFTNGSNIGSVNSPLPVTITCN